MALDVLGQTTFSHLGRGAETRTAVLGFAAATAGGRGGGTGRRMAHGGAQLRGDGGARPVWQG